MQALFYMIVLVVLSANPTTAPAASADTLTAGVAVVDITPPVGYRMAGYPTERISTEVQNSLQAKALVFAQGDTAGALVACDVIGIPRDVTDGARKLAEEKTGIPAHHIAVFATHTHTGPLYYGPQREFFHKRAIDQHGKDPREEVNYADLFAAKIVEAIVQARAAAVPVRVDAGVAMERRLSFNRRFHMADGSVRFNPGQQNPDIVRAAGPIDPEVGIVRLRDAGRRRPMAVLTVFPLHCDTVGGTAYAADYPYYLSKGLCRDQQDLVSVFGNGTCGDINHIDVSTKGRRSAEEIGSMLAETVRVALTSLHDVGEPALAIRSEQVAVPLQRYSPEQIDRAARALVANETKELPFLQRVEAYKIMDLARYKDPTLPLEVQVFRLGRDVAIVTLPGEVFVDLGLAIKKASPFKTTLVIELANDSPAYIPTKKAFAEGSYETVNSRVAPGGGETIVAAAVKLLKELGG
ncbi:MAG: neutral/alkaline non-lysosomal ceramidase N-terminal domain-containing protein [Phycisphaerae bacterium]|nr:neutral/alkaline non-lysosomal ceramidase N-terminal domain-containing protein [Phycisphaerae bacterium]